jgi:hypothetical protein
VFRGAGDQMMTGNAKWVNRSPAVGWGLARWAGGVRNAAKLA